jgi:serine/threonine protein kinase/Flp pilus assembly protein TadD
MIGKTLSHYRILEQLGAGGMGEVFRAEDMTLRRHVALKVLPPEVADSQERLLRFQREAESLAALDHPNIVTIFSVEAADGIHFLTMQLVEGETLAEKLASGLIPADSALALFRQIARALSAAHAKGIIHRDLKPANIMVSADGRARLLDFGLAKANPMASEEETSPSPKQMSQFPTLTAQMTSPGVILGTVAYMSPEQARGQPTDQRCDIWAFGCCLYEALSGQPVFLAETVSDTIAAILMREPEWQRLPAELPESVRELLRRCLRKDLSMRPASITDLDLAISAMEATSAQTPSGPRSVAALPFLNLSSDPENEHFADGMTEDVITQLSKIAELKVISRTSVMPFKKERGSLREMASMLDVETLLDGSVRRAGNRVRIVAQLIEARTEQQLWAETYDRELDDIFAIQSDVALQIAAALQAELAPGVKSRIEKRPTANLEAYHLYLEGRHCSYQLTDKGIRRGLELYDNALRLDPDYALAHAGRAYAYTLIGMGFSSSVLLPREAYSQAKEAAYRALELDEDLAEAHGVLGLVKMAFEFDWAGAEEEILRALELNPGNAEIHDIHSLFLSALERHEESIRAVQKARELDPLATVPASDLATRMLRAGRYEEAVREATRLLELEPHYPMAHSTLGWARLKQGRTEEGLAALVKAVEAAPGNNMLLAQLGQAYADVGRLEEARGIEEQLGQISQERYVSPYHMAYLYTGLGDLDRAIDCLEQAYEEHASGLYGVKGSFLFTPLHGHPRFQALLGRMNLA